MISPSSSKNVSTCRVNHTTARIHPWICPLSTTPISKEWSHFTLFVKYGIPRSSCTSKITVDTKEKVKNDSVYRPFPTYGESPDGFPSTAGCLLYVKRDVEWLCMSDQCMRAGLWDLEVDLIWDEWTLRRLQPCIHTGQQCLICGQLHTNATPELLPAMTTFATPLGACHHTAHKITEDKSRE